eukprot:TRINITY_DN11268_c0_g1_i1.p2 TRINITY_DN11268_c0_g1~~TRINITY_DN11268_c0_g1_i1.p2  ORF type:complete len:208 (-),score=60.17 TRINITY_DN11268_c0_g1_i1:299-922(-)
MQRGLVGSEMCIRDRWYQRRVHGGKLRKKSPKQQPQKVSTFKPPAAACKIIGREEKQWLAKHGKNEYIDFQDAELKKLREYFDYLDKDKGGSISAEELEEPLIALGFAENRDDIQRLINVIDKNGNGEIELDEFLAIIKTGRQDSGGPGLGVFFKGMINGDYSKGQMPIPLSISDYRRKMIIKSMIGESPEEKEKGKKNCQSLCSTN